VETKMVRCLSEVRRGAISIAFIVAMLFAFAPQVAVAEIAGETYPLQWSVLNWREHEHDKPRSFAKLSMAFAHLTLAMPKLPQQKFSGRSQAEPEDGKVHAILLRLRLPDFKPFVPAVPQNIRGDIEEVVEIELRTGKYAKLAEYIKQKGLGASVSALEPVPDGQIRTQRRTQVEEWAYSYLPTEGFRLFALCSVGGTVDHCRSTFEIENNEIAVSYRFAKAPHFARWAELDAKVRLLVKSFYEY